MLGKMKELISNVEATMEKIPLISKTEFWQAQDACSIMWAMNHL